MLNPKHTISKELAGNMFQRGVDRVTEALVTSFGVGRYLIVVDQGDNDPLLVTLGTITPPMAVGLMGRLINTIQNDLDEHRNAILASPIYRLRRNLPNISRNAGDLARVLKTDQDGVHVAFEDQMDRTYIFEDLGPLEPVQTLAEAGRLSRVELLTDFHEFKLGERGRISFDGALAYENPPIMFDRKQGVVIGVPAGILKVLD